jgi:hypothetical protein
MQLTTLLIIVPALFSRSFALPMPGVGASQPAIVDAPPPVEYHTETVQHYTGSHTTPAQPIVEHHTSAFPKDPYLKQFVLPNRELAPFEAIRELPPKAIVRKTNGVWEALFQTSSTIAAIKVTPGRDNFPDGTELIKNDPKSTEWVVTAGGSVGTPHKQGKRGGPPVRGQGNRKTSRPNAGAV